MYLGPELSLDALDGRAPALKAATMFSPLVVSVDTPREDDPELWFGSAILSVLELSARLESTMADNLSSLLARQAAQWEQYG